MAGRRTLEVRMDLNDKCNLRCAMCYFHAGSGKGEMPAPVLTRVVDEILPRAHTLYLSCGAEPFMSPGFVPALERARAAGVPSIRLVSNGLLLSEKNVRALLDNDVEMIEVSLDGATAETYASIRIGGNLETLRGNLLQLRKGKEERRSPRPELRLRWLLMRRNLEELPQLVDFAREVGAAGIGLQHLVIYNPPMEAEAISTDELKRACDRAVAETRRRAADAGIAFDAPPDFFPPPPSRPRFVDWARWQLREGIPSRLGLRRRATATASGYRQKCFEPWQKVYVTHAGVVLPCPVWSDSPLGALAESGFGEIWDGPRYEALRRELESGELRSTCRACPIYHGDTAWK